MLPHESRIFADCPPLKRQHGMVRVKQCYSSVPFTVAVEGVGEMPLRVIPDEIVGGCVLVDIEIEKPAHHDILAG